jgi:tyrosine-protein phosphatase SIW14
MSSDAAMVVPPYNHAIVSSGVYRSAFPTKNNLPYLQRLRLKTIVCITAEAYSQEVSDFLDDMGVAKMRVPLEENIEPFQLMSEVAVRDIMRCLTDPYRRPVLIHGLAGVKRTSCVVGCLRKCQLWTLTPILEEYHKYVGRNAEGNLIDHQFIELFCPPSLISIN